MRDIEQSRRQGRTKVGAAKRADMLRHKDLKGAIGLLDAPPQTLPQAHKQIDFEEDQVFRRFAISIAQRCQVEIAFSVGIVKHQDRVEIAILPGGVKPGAGIKTNGRAAKARTQIVELLFKGNLL